MLTHIPNDDCSRNASEAREDCYAFDRLLAGIASDQSGFTESKLWDLMTRHVTAVIGSMSDEGCAQEAFDAYIGLRKLERDNPTLAENQFFQDALTTAHQTFIAIFETL